MSLRSQHRRSAPWALPVLSGFGRANGPALRDGSVLCDGSDLGIDARLSDTGFHLLSNPCEIAVVKPC
jgi:hypothetical protein